MAGEQKVTKLIIKAFNDMQCKDAKAGTNEIELQVNPQELELAFSVNYGDDSGSSSSGGNTGFTNENDSAAGESFPMPIFKSYEVPGLNVNTVIDATGVIPAPTGYDGKLVNGTEPSVQPYIDELKAVCYNYVEETHGPPYLALQWLKVLPSQSNNEGKTAGLFHCQLKELKVKYTLFSASGNPVRAELDFTFKGIEDPEIRATGASPDLTHYIDVQYGDNLPKLCKDIYGSTEFYMQVARINGLPSIYALEPGMKLLFPPLDKASR
jgi:hypothetical protein